MRYSTALGHIAIHMRGLEAVVIVHACRAVSPITAAALVFAALFSVLIFSVVALSMLREGDSALPTSLGETRQFEPATALVPSHRPSA